tara:strand:+ start:7053 stop:8312 length:1260 start_codon:yes stop_codon:yes gene_type:complete
MLVLSITDFGNQYEIDDKILERTFLNRTTDEITNVLRLSSYILDKIPSIVKNEGILYDIEGIVDKKNESVFQKIESVNENLLCLTSGNSSLLGKFNENIIEKYLKIHFPHYEIINTATSGEKCGDIVVNTRTNMGRISIESKNYDVGKPIPSGEIDKFKRDLMNSGIKYGILISTNSRITGKNTIDYEIYKDKIILYVGPAGHDNFLLNLGIHYLKTLNELDAIHTRRINIRDNKCIRDKLDEISRTFEIGLSKLNHGVNQINETEKKMASTFSLLRSSLQEIISDFNINLEKMNTEISDLKEGSCREYSQYAEIVDAIRNGRPDKNANKTKLLERLFNELHQKSYQFKIEESDIGFYKEDIYSGKVNYKGRSRIDIFFKETEEYTRPYPKKIVSMKNDNYIIELKENAETWAFILEKI